jgi:hypothetical protein
MTSGHGCHGQVLNEEFPYHERSIQDVIIKNLQMQVTELTQHLAVQNLEIYCDIDDRISKSNFKNPYHKHVMFREERV